ncbi:P-loop ATPase, Sll1717 family [Aeromonas veronii]|uniref:P-loop ATPase, Sll1717 family n=1 Tax=Aeromonas veronii TaxID=654 RepID=UPI003BA0441F
MKTSGNWKTLSELKEPFNDAVNYKSKDEKQFFSGIFLKTNELQRCLSPSTYYLMGEKGTGKTAYAVFLENNNIGDNLCQLTTMTETQYKRFIALKREGKIAFSDYANIWRSILLLITSQMIIHRSKNIFTTVTRKFSHIEKAIEKWNKDALNPEIESAFELLNSTDISANITAKDFGDAGVKSQTQTAEKTVKIKHHLLETERLLKDAIKSLKLSKNHILFIDGIDYRPEGVSYTEYIECIKGLSEAAWQLNSEFFNSIKDSKGRLKIMLLIRPDVFHKLNLYNSNSRLQDNCVFLNWSTTEKDFEKSKLFEASGKFFSNQQRFPVHPHEAWIHYHNGSVEGSSAFRKLLKSSFQKPRDILTYIKIIRRHYLETGKGESAFIGKNALSDPSVNREYADYLLGEVRNYASFYMKLSDFGIYIKFFQYLDGKANFTAKEFSLAFDKFKAWASGETVYAKEFLHDPETLLQFFYDVNIIGYKEKLISNGDSFYHWAYKERTLNNISPKIKDAAQLILNPGIAKALDIGKETKTYTEEVKPKRRKKKPNNRWRRTRGNSQPTVDE